MKRNSTTSRLLLALLSVVLLSVGWLGLSGITLLAALVPLLIISEGYSDSRRDWWRMCGWGAATFLLWSAATIWWVWIATPIGPITAGIVGTFYNLCGLMTYHYVSKRAPRALAYTLLVTIWIATEWAYNSADVMTFPWLLLGHGFSQDIWAVQWYEFTGIFGGTLWGLVSNIAIFEVWRTRTKGAKIRAALITLLPILASVALYFNFEPSTESAKITVVQPNVPCYDEERAAAGMNNPTDRVCSLVASAPKESSFVILPESALAYIPYTRSIDEGNLESYATLFSQMHGGNNTDTKLVTGASTMRIYGDESETNTAHYYDPIGWYDYFNSALLCNANGEVERIYHKGKLVIGVEAVPLRNIFDLFEVDLGGISGQLGWGTEYTLFKNQDVVLGPSICYEGLYGEYFAGFVREGANLMAVISNDGWWGDTPGHRRLFDFCRLRAIETRRAIARSANTGISGFITPRGENASERLLWDEQGTITADVELRNEKTIYVCYGDWIARISTLVATLSLLYYVAYRVRRRNHLVD